MRSVKRVLIALALGSLIAISGCFVRPKGTAEPIGGRKPDPGERLVTLGANNRCALLNSQGGTFRVRCHLVVKDDSQSEVEALGLAEGITADWLEPASDGATVKSLACTTSTDKLSQDCDIQIADDASALVHFTVRLFAQQTQEEAVKTDSVKLPFSVMSFGDVSTLQPFALGSTSSAIAEKRFGFQTRLERIPTQVKIGVTSSVCYQTDDFLVFTAENTVFGFDRVQNALYLIAGNSNLAGANRLSPFLISLGAPPTDWTGVHLGCDPSRRGDKFYVADSYHSRVVSISNAGEVIQVAGTGEEGFSGDGGPATLAKFNNPWRVTVLSSGELVISDAQNSRLRKILKNGIVQTIAGSGSKAFTGDGGPARLAGLHYPAGVAELPDGSLLVADRNHHRIRKIAPNGIISTFAGLGTPGFSGDGGPANLAEFNMPTDIMVAPDGSIYVADVENRRIRVIQGGVVRTIAGAGVALENDQLYVDSSRALDQFFYYPSGLAIGKNGALVTADRFARKLREIYPDGRIAAIAGNTGSSPLRLESRIDRLAFQPVRGLVALPDGSAYIADGARHQISRIASDSSIVMPYIGGKARGFGGDGGKASDALFYNPVGVALAPNGDVYIADLMNHRIRYADRFGIVRTAVGNGTAASTGDGGPAGAASIIQPIAVAIAADGDIYFLELVGTSGAEWSRLRKVDVQTGIISAVAGVGPIGFSGDGGPATAARLSEAQAFALGPDGTVFISDQRNYRVRMVSPLGIITTIAGNGRAGYAGDGGFADEASIGRPYGLSVDPDGKVWMADPDNSAIRVLTPTPSGRYRIHTEIGGSAHGSGQCSGRVAVREDVEANRLQEAMKLTLDKVCLARIQAISRRCVKGEMVMYLSQEFSMHTGNVVRIAHGSSACEP